MLYVFADETYPDPDRDPSEILVSTLTAPQASFNRIWAAIPALMRQGRTSRAELLAAFIRKNQFLPQLLLAGVPAGREPIARDWSPDIGEIARTDFVWSHAFAYAIGYSIKHVLDAGWTFKTVDVLHDPKSLTPAHRTFVEAAFTTLIGKHASAYSIRHGGHRIKVRRLTTVPKPDRTAPYTKEQAGVWVAHTIASCRNDSHFALQPIDARSIVNDVFEARDAQQPRRDA